MLPLMGSTISKSGPSRNLLPTGMGQSLHWEFYQPLRFNLHLLHLVTVLLICAWHPAGALDCKDVRTDGSWVVSTSLLSTVKNDLQQIVDCVPKMGVLIFESSLSLQLEGILTLHQPIVVKGEAKGEKRPVITCGKKGAAAVEILSNGVEMENLVIQGCKVASGWTAGVIINAPVLHNISAGENVNSILFKGVDFLDHFNSEGPGALLISSAIAVHFQKVAFIGNTGKHGGAVSCHSRDTDITFDKCLFEGNAAENSGGGLNQDPSTRLTISNSIFRNNTAEEGGGAICLLGGSSSTQTNIRSTEFYFNTAIDVRNPGQHRGGAIIVLGSNIHLEIQKCNFTKNFAFNEGGAIAFTRLGAVGRVTANVTGTLFHGNIARWGGALNVQSSLRLTVLATKLKVHESVFSNNQATVPHIEALVLKQIREAQLLFPGAGGAIRTFGLNVHIDLVKSTFEGNKAEALGNIDQRGPIGGAIVMIDIDKATIIDTTFNNNTASSRGAENVPGYGGAVYIKSEGNPTAQVKGAPAGSSCANQCDANTGLILNQSDEVGGCGVLSMGHEKLCLLKESGECAMYPVKQFELPFEDSTLAVCKVVVSSSEVTILRATFTQNVVDGHGGAISLTGMGLKVNTSGTVAFTGNIAEGGKGGAVFLNQGAQLSGNGTHFEGNTGVIGGAVSLNGSSTQLHMKSAFFTNNKATNGIGGAISEEGDMCSMSLVGNTTFIGNTARGFGGAIGTTCIHADAIINQAFFVGNSATKSGGGIYAHTVQGTNTIDMVDVTFVNNTILAPTEPEELEHGIGGAIAAMSEGVQLYISGGSNLFLGNEARAGGAIRFIQAFPSKIYNTTFTRNAALSGGAIYATFLINSANKTLDLSSVRFLRNVGHIGAGVAIEGRHVRTGPSSENELAPVVFGAAVASQVTPQAWITNAVFEYQTVTQDAGGMHLVNAHAICTNCNFTHNEVADALKGGGGGIKLQDFAVLEINHAILSNNKAAFGGGISLENSLLFSADLVVKNNTASGPGGGIHVVNTLASLRNCDITRNFSLLEVKGGDISMNTGSKGGGIFLEGAIFRGANLTINENTAATHGGGVFGDSNSCDNSSIHLEHCIISSNRADTGGGICLKSTAQLGGSPPDPENLHTVGLPDTINQIISLARSLFRAKSPTSMTIFGENGSDLLMMSTTNVVLVDCDISNNFAQRSGGAIYTTYEEMLCVCCSGVCSTFCPKNNIVQQLEACSETWHGNELGPLGYGPKIASMADRVYLISNLEAHIEDGTLFEDAHNSGEPLPTFAVEVRDAYDQLVTLCESDVFAFVSASEGLLSGEVSMQVVEGYAYFDLLFFSGNPAEYNLSVEFPDESNLRRHTFRVKVRDCRQGEIDIAGNWSTSFRCEKCPIKTIGINPKQDCRDCPDNAECDGTTVVPNSGYWHESTLSLKIYECLTDEACQYDGRTETLRNESVKTGSELAYNQGYSLCKKGYTGILCGSCSSGYGRIAGLKCAKCPQLSVSIVVTVLEILSITLVLIFFIWRALRHYNCNSETQCTSRTQPSISRESSALGGPDTNRKGPKVNPMTENAKILINFLQVNSIGHSLNVPWKQEVVYLLFFEEMVSGMSTTTAFSSADCYLIRDSSIPISIQRSIVTLLLPIAFMLLISFVWLIVTTVKRHSYAYCSQRIRLSIMVVVYLMYVGITRGSLRVLQSVHVDVFNDSEVVHGHGKQWAYDTNLNFFKGSHAVLANTLGIPMLLIFSVGFPLSITIMLRWHKLDLLDGQWCRVSTFLYLAYKPRYAYWEMVVLARKTLLVAIVVLCFPLGSNLQGILAVLVLASALTLHLYAMPYREDINRMNYREALSLSISGITYILSLALNDGRITERFKTFSSIVMIIISISFVVVQLVFTSMEGARHIDTMLVSSFIAHPSTSTVVHKSKLLCNHYWNKYIHHIPRRLDITEITARGEANREMGRASANEQ